MHHLPALNILRKLILLDELPRNTMGKVQKNILRDQYKDTFAPCLTRASLSRHSPIAVCALWINCPGQAHQNNKQKLFPLATLLKVASF
jgi:hypothetical protein